MSLLGVILDMDGTLVDSNDAHARAWVEALRMHEIEAPLERVRPLIGMGGDKLLRLAASVEKDSPAGRSIESARKEIFENQYLPGIAAFPGVRELVETMRARGLRLVVASSSEESLLDKLLRLAKVEDLLEERVGSGEVEETKPAPDLVHAALNRLQLPAERAVMVGDTPYDVEAAGSAGVAAVALKSGGWDERALAGAIAIYRDPADLLSRFEESPFS